MGKTVLRSVLTAEGQVMTWKLTKGLAFDNIADKLTSLQEWFVRHGVVLQEFFIDNCCSWRKKLQNLKVYLDVFHAVQRISRKIPKRHPFRQEWSYTPCE